MRDRLNWIASLTMASTLYVAPPAVAAALPFTWDPAGSAPALAGPGSAFTADAIFSTGHLTDVGQPDGTGATHQINVVTGFGLGGNPVSPAGFGSLYGLYFDQTDTHTINPPPDILHFSSINVILKADPGNNNGAVLATTAGVSFANTGPTGQADDIALATGSLVTSSSFLDVSTGVLSTESVLTFLPTAGQEGFFLSPPLGGSVFLRTFNANPASFVSTPQPDGTTITTFNGFTNTGQLIATPEPSSLALLAVGFLGFAPLLRRPRH